MARWTARRAGENGYLVDVPDADPAQLADGVRGLCQERGIGLVEVVPGMSTVLIVFQDPRAVQIETLLAEVDAAPASGEVGTLTIDVQYDGPDLAEVAALTGLAEQQVIDLHTQTEFRAAFSGFAPGFAYLTGVPQQLRVPRRPDPRPVVPAGSVALADEFTAVYPKRLPGGWQLIGTTQQPLWIMRRNPPAVIRPGMTVRFRQVG
ncbi:5-oxoprolinase subunit B family protein [Kineosporia babensis]|uniref:Carboxyltransferase domain-containing protein n=1 Tax=Kineosporia babensis TaxID=499548 RepID=A0A9X1N9T4_9ACTN|nr:carboxyltransferase domain-containing protein [Kineosporia babensis]MCD5309780.1 carboxyltransferase domain-containing protein [Kineosporia babensis]